MNGRVLMVSVVLCLIILTGFSSLNKIDSIKINYANSNQEKILSDLSKKPLSKVFEEINIISGDGINNSNLIAHANTVSKRLNEISDEEVVKNIKDESNSNNLKIILIQSLQNQSGNLDKNIDSEFLKMVKNKNIDKEVRENLIWTLNNNSATTSTLEDIVFNDDEKLAFQAMKKIRSYDSEKAIKIADKIIAKYYSDKIQNERVRSAVKAKVEFFRHNKSLTKESDAFISLCIELLENPSYELMKDTAIFSLSELQNEAAISYILSSNDVEDYLKVYCIDQNYTTLLSMINNNLSDENIEIVIKAMNIYPITDLITPLKKVMEQSPNKQFSTSLIETEGNPVNKKWINY
ncbi:hypothetical protein BHU72_14685 [Desulfuribacillus stibiiarsenatis]|uniref:HEAT repeat domain-containing protein n=2 Tax=Desulfuribacillus stibiiarsenatis TaxID=1390249 RepID=A0A1E5L808_9FIRM|nr:hypothetical protein BHU72_14685 [Desulfuribacillus stibiiarsenatis]